MKASPRVTARLAGTLYLISGVPAGFSVYVFLQLVVRGDPAATATSIVGAERLGRDVAPDGERMTGLTGLVDMALGPVP